LPDFLNRKKELMKKRENLLVEIGLDIINNNRLPEGHENLPRDMRRNERMLQEGQKHLKALESKWTFFRTEGSELRKKEKEFIEKKQQSIDHLQKELETQFYKDETNVEKSDRYTLLKQEIGQKKNKFQLSKQKLTKQLAENDKLMNHFQNEVDQTRVNLDLLEETKRMRLRDLAYDYFTKNKKDSHYATKFGHYQLIQLELQELCAQEKPQKGISQIPNERKTWQWVWIPLFVLVSLAILLFFRNEFTTHQISFSMLARNMSLEEGESRYMFNWDTTPESMKQKIFSSLRSVQDVSLIQLDPSTLSGIKRVLLSENPDQSLAFLAIELNSPIYQLEKGFLEKGWYRKKNEWAVEAFTKNNWVWYHLNPSQFLYYPDDKELFDHQEPDGKELDVFLHTNIDSFDASYPLLEGYGFLHLEKSQASFEWILKRNETPPDQNLRERYLEEIKRRSDSPFNIHFQGNELHAAGPASFLTGWQSPNDCVLRVCRKTEELEEQTDRTAAEEFFFESNPENTFSPADMAPLGSQTIIKMRLKNHKLEIEGSAWIGQDISDLFYSKLNDELWVLDSGLNMIAVFSTIGNDFLLKTRQMLPEYFTAKFMIQDPIGSRAVIFGGERKGKQPINFGIIDLNNPAEGQSGSVPIKLVVVPSHIDEISSAAWDEQSDSLFLGVSSRGERGQRSHGLITYGLDSGKASLRQLIDFPVGKSGKVVLSSLIYNPSRKILYALDQHQGVLQFFNVTNGVIGQKNGVFLSQRMSMSLQRNPVLHSDPFLMALSRDTKTLALLDLTDYSGKNFGDQCFLLDLESSPPIITHQIGINSHLASIQGVPLSNHFVVISGKQPQLTLIHIEEGLIKMDCSIRFKELLPRRIAIDPLGETIFVSATLRSSAEQ